jgi:hypothetical protein
MEPWLIAVALKGFFGLAFFSVVWLMAAALRRFIPDGAVKALLYDPQIQKRHPWKFFLGFALVFYGVIALISVLV